MATTLTFLGTGTSQGVPVIGCSCEVCTSPDPRDQRLRTSAMFSVGNTNLVVDTGPDFRQQMLRAHVQDVKAILLTHEHNDHVIGLDDIRPFNFKHRQDMPLYGTRQVLDEVRRRFDYIFRTHDKYPGAPGVEPVEISRHHTFHIGDIPIIPIEVMHGRLPVLGFRIGNLAYLTDVKTISEKEIEKLAGTQVLVLNALHHRPHYSHLNLEEALHLARKINPERTYFTHISHHMGLHEEQSPLLPENVYLAYDGLKVHTDI